MHLLDRSCVIVGIFLKYRVPQQEYTSWIQNFGEQAGVDIRPVESEMIWTNLKLVEKPDNVCYPRLMGIG